MALNRRQPNRRKKIQTPPALDEQLFAQPVGPEPRFNDVFDPRFDFAPDVANEAGWEPASIARPHRAWFSRRRLLSLQRVLLVGILLVVAMLVYTVVRRAVPAPASSELTPRATGPAAQPIAVGPPVSQSPAAAPSSDAPEQPAADLLRPEPLSLQMAEKFYLANDFENALVTYDKLYKRLPATEQNQPMRDFLLFRMALCGRSMGSTEQADSLLRTVAMSRFPILRAIARYHQSTTLLRRQRYLEAAARAYQTLALAEVVDWDRKWSAAVQRQCYFLVAEAMTRNLLALRETEGDLPGELWSEHPQIDPFVRMDEAQLKVVLNSGCETLNEAVLSPQVQLVIGQGATDRWSVTCNGASLEELLARFADSARLNIHWAESGQPPMDEESGRRNPVYLHLTSATAQQVVTVAAGSAGLLARIDAERNVHVVDPSSQVSLAEQVKLLAEESVSLWQRFLLAADDDRRVPNGHFALAMLHTVRERLDQAVAEYKVVANRFPKHALAPLALLNSGRLKIRLRDYTGAHQDLKQLIELYPDTKSSDQACLALADTTMKTGLYEEAAGLYRKVFNLGLSVDSQIESALGAGRCSYEMKDFEAAAKWLNQYVALARDRNRREYPSACLMLGKTYLALNNSQQAQVALNLALRGELSRQQHVETMITLVKTYLQDRKSVV